MNEVVQHRLEAVFEVGNVLEEVKAYWLEKIGAMPEALQFEAINLFEYMPEDLGWFKDIQIKKEEALKAGDKAKWEAIVTEEKEKLSKFING
jgi:hypothetical protein